MDRGNKDQISDGAIHVTHPPPCAPQQCQPGQCPPWLQVPTWSDDEINILGSSYAEGIPSRIILLGPPQQSATDGLQQQTFTLLQLWGLEVQDQGADRSGSSGGPSPLGLQMAVSSLCPHMALCLRELIPGVFSLFLPRHQSYWIKAAPYDLI